MHLAPYILLTKCLSMVLITSRNTFLVLFQRGKDINRSRLPTVKKTLLCYLANYDHGNTTQRDAANATVSQVLGGAIYGGLHKRYKTFLSIPFSHFIARREREL